jgi:hypothetical protein
METCSSVDFWWSLRKREILYRSSEDPRPHTSQGLPINLLFCLGYLEFLLDMEEKKKESLIRFRRFLVSPVLSARFSSWWVKNCLSEMFQKSPKGCQCILSAVELAEKPPNRVLWEYERATLTAENPSGKVSHGRGTFKDIQHLSIIWNGECFKQVYFELVIYIVH